MNAGRARGIALAAAALATGLLLVTHSSSTLALLPVLLVMLLTLTVRAPIGWRLGAGLALLLIAIPLAGFRNTFLFELGTQMGIYAALALGLNVTIGKAGLLDLGYASFFAIGAYTWAIFGSPQANEFIHGGLFPLAGWPWFYLFAAIALVVAALAGVLIGLPALRLRGDYLAIVTLGFGEVVRTLANNLDRPLNLTNGPQGITPISKPPAFIPMPSGSGAGDAYSLFFYLLVLAVIGLVVLVNVRLDRSRHGRAWVAIREDEIAARSMGISLLRAKMLAFATGASFAGVMGAIYAAKQNFVSPESFTLLQSITILSMVILGGMGSLRGVVVGAMAVTLLNLEVLKSFSQWLNELRQAGTIINLGFTKYNLAELPTQLEPAKYERMIFGIILILMMIFRPGGMIPERRHKLEMEDD